MRMMTWVARSRTIIGLLAILLLSPLLVDRARAQPSIQCGTWTLEASGPANRAAVELIDDGGPDCEALLRLTNTSPNLGTLGGSGYGVIISNAEGVRSSWPAGFAGANDERGYLPHALTIDLQLAPNDPTAASSATLEISATTDSIDHDAALFLLHAVFDRDTTCPISDASLAEIAVQGSPDIESVSAQAREFRYEQALLELNRTLPAYLEAVAGAARNTGIDCAEDVLSKIAANLDEPDGLAMVTRIGLAFVTTLGKAAWSEFHTGAEPTVISARYAPATPEATAVATPTAQPDQAAEPPPPAPSPTAIPTEPPPSTEPAPIIPGEIAYVPYGQGEIWLEDMQTGSSEQITSGHEPWYANVRFTLDGRNLLYINSPVNRGDLYLRSLDSGQELAVDSPTLCATVSPDGSTVAYAVLPAEDPSGERVEVWMFNLASYQYRLAYELVSEDLVALLGIDATSEAAVRAFKPDEHQQGCELAWSAGDWLYLSLALDVQVQCALECAALPVTFRMNNGAVQSLSAPVSLPSLDGLPQSLQPLAGSLCLGVPTASLDGVLAFTRCRTPQGSGILLWDAAGAWHEVAPGVAAELSPEGSWLFIEQDGSLTCDGVPCQAGTIIVDSATLEPLPGRIDGAQVTFRPPR